MSANERIALPHVAIVGGGVVALAAAAGFARAMPGGRVTLVGAPVPAAAFADRLPLAWPSALAPLAALGLPAEALVARGIARPRLAARYADWSRDGATFLVGDDAAPATPRAALHQLWLRAGGDLPFHALIPACVAAEAGTAPPAIEAALHLDAGRLAGALAAACRDRGVALAPALAGVERDAGGVAALRLADGARIEAALYVDASGPARLLAAPDAAIEDWDAALPCDRVVLAAPSPLRAPLDDHRAIDIGWTARWPAAAAIGWRAALATGDEARRALGGDGETVAIAAGRLASPWSGNVLALGEAAAQPGPLGLAGFTLALHGLALALELMPGGRDEPLLRAEYDRRAGLRADRVRDVLAAHYHGGGRRRGAFWQAIAASPTPGTLAARLAQVARRGHLPPADEESVGRDAWLALLLGLGIRPARADPVALGIDRAEAARLVAGVAAHARRTAGLSA